MNKIIANNNKAYHNYFIEDKYEAGIELKGSEVKSLRNHKCSLQEALCKILHNECYILNFHIAPYEFGNIWNEDPMRTRKLLLHKKEILKIQDKLQLKGYTLIPLQVYFKNGLVKIELGICKGKKLYDKRQDKKNKAIDKHLKQIIKKEIKR